MAKTTKRVATANRVYSVVPGHKDGLWSVRVGTRKRGVTAAKEVGEGYARQRSAIRGAQRRAARDGALSASVWYAGVFRPVWPILT